MKKIAALVFTVVAFIIFITEILSTATPHWFNTYNTYRGLFQNCIYRVGCGAISDPTSSLQAVRAFMIIAIIASAATVAICVAVSRKKLPAILIPILFASAALSVMIAMITYTEKNKYLDYGYSYYLGWAGFTANVVSSVISGLMVKGADYLPI